MEKRDSKFLDFRKRGNLFLIAGFSIVFFMISLLYLGYFYLEKNDPTKRLYYYPSTKSEVVDINGDIKFIENFFPGYNNYDFFHEKKDVNYKTLQVLLGKPFNIEEFREVYEFSIMKKPENDESVEYGIYRYYVYDVLSIEDPVSVIYVDIETNVVVGITGPYMVNGEFRDIELNGANFSEITRLDAFMNDEDKIKNGLTPIYDGMYAVSSQSKEEQTIDDTTFNTIYSVIIRTDKVIDSIMSLVDFYLEEENYVTIYFASFIDMENYGKYIHLIK